MTSFILDLKLGVYFPCYLPHGNPPFESPQSCASGEVPGNTTAPCARCPRTGDVVVAVSGTCSRVVSVRLASLAKVLVPCFSPQFARPVATGSLRLLHAVRRKTPRNERFRFIGAVLVGIGDFLYIYISRVCACGDVSGVCRVKGKGFELTAPLWCLTWRRRSGQHQYPWRLRAPGDPAQCCCCCVETEEKLWISRLTHWMTTTAILGEMKLILPPSASLWLIYLLTNAVFIRLLFFLPFAELHNSPEPHQKTWDGPLASKEPPIFSRLPLKCRLFVWFHEQHLSVGCISLPHTVDCSWSPEQSSL